MSQRTAFRHRLEQANSNDYLFRTAVYLTALFFAGLILIPMSFVVAVSFTPPESIFGALGFIPENPTLATWENALSTLAPYLVNSAIIATGTAIISLLIAVPGAYVFGRLKFSGKKILFYIVIIAMMFPYIILIIPITTAWLSLGLYNTILGLWIAHQIFVTPFAVWILRDFFAKLPNNLEEAAQVYGCTQFSAFARVILPISLPAVMAVAFLSFLTGWNDFLFSNLLTTSTGPRPAVVHLYVSVRSGTGEQIEWGLLMAESLIIGLPPLILYFVSQRYLSNAFAK